MESFCLLPAAEKHIEMDTLDWGNLATLPACREPSTHANRKTELILPTPCGFVYPRNTATVYDSNLHLATQIRAQRDNCFSHITQKIRLLCLSTSWFDYSEISSFPPPPFCFTACLFCCFLICRSSLWIGKCTCQEEAVPCWSLKGCCLFRSQLCQDPAVLFAVPKLVLQ